MRGRVPALEQRFFDIFCQYYDLERNPVRQFSDSEYSLARMEPIAALAGHPEQRLRIVHVAGTKGKGSTCHLISALLGSAGYRCGMFTSPHLATVRERFQIGNDLIPYDVLLEASREFEAGLRRAAITPSLFEIMTVLSLSIFSEKRCDFAIMETGIGGRLDSTNYVKHPECCAITAVSLDHTQLLGSTPEQIAAEKAGIIKPGVPVVVGEQPFPEALGVILKRAGALQAPVRRPVPADRVAPFLATPLPPFIRDNARTALAVCDALGISPRSRLFRLPEFRARCEVIRQSPLVILDAAHNADSARRLVESLGDLFPGTRFAVVLGVVKGKDVAGIVRQLSDLDAEFILTNPDTTKGSEIDALISEMRLRGLPHRVIEHLHTREQLPHGANLLFTGSFFTALIGESLFNP